MKAELQDIIAQLTSLRYYAKDDDIVEGIDNALTHLDTAVDRCLIDAEDEDEDEDEDI
jgi:hypothetical protein